MLSLLENVKKLASQNGQKPVAVVENKSPAALELREETTGRLLMRLGALERREVQGDDFDMAKRARKQHPQWLGLVTEVERDEQADRERLFANVWALVFFAFVGALVVAIVEPSLSLVAWSVFTAILVGSALFGWAKANKGGGSRVWLAQMGSMAASLLLGLGIPAAVIFVFGGGRELLDPSTSVELALLGRILQALFIGVAASLPALLYYLFDRNRLSTLRSQFERQCFRLDPSVATLDDVRAKYGGQLEDVYGQLDGVDAAGDGKFRSGTRWPLVIVTVLFAFGWVVTLLPVGTPVIDKPQDLWNLFAPEQNSVVFGFLGVYFFAVTMILRRYVRGDLRPKAYSSILVRLYVVVIFAWLFDVLVDADSAGLFADDEPYQLAIVFFIGVVPDVFLTFVSERLRGRWLGRAVKDLEEKQPLSLLEGIDLYDRARLLDEGVANIESLAHHDLIDLVVETRIPVARLVDWVDQAILYLHIAVDDVQVAKPANGEQPGVAPPDGGPQDAAGGAPPQVDLTSLRRARLREYGIRTATDLIETHKKAQRRKEGDELLKALDPTVNGAEAPKPLAYRVILDALADDEWLANVQRWRKGNTPCPSTKTVQVRR